MVATAGIPSFCFIIGMSFIKANKGNYSVLDLADEFFMLETTIMPLCK
jgi:hypothetical protein